MNAAELPNSFFMIGTRESQVKFSPNIRKLADNVFLVCVWTSRLKLADWLARRDQPRAHFEIERQIAFAAFIHTPAMRYVVVDAGPEENPYDDGFILTSLPADRTIDLHSATDVGTVWADTSEGMQILAQFSLTHPAIRPFELTKSFVSFLNQSGNELKAKGEFDVAWNFVRQKLKILGLPETAFEVIKITWLSHVELSSTEALEYGGKLLQHTVGELKASGDFDIVWRFVEANLRNRRVADELLSYIKDIAAESEELTCPQAVEKAQQIVTLLITSVKSALSKFPPPDVCLACGQQGWSFVPLSPDPGSATWRCVHCLKEIIVDVDVVRRRSSSSARGPIPKAVQREVWRRDQGRCVNCGSQDRLEFDHLIPHSKGGSATARNIQLLCEKCNRSKSDNDPGHY